MSSVDLHGTSNTNYQYFRGVKFLAQGHNTVVVGFAPESNALPLNHRASHFDIVNFPFLDGVVPRRPSYGVYISQLIGFARVCSHVVMLMLVIMFSC